MEGVLIENKTIKTPLSVGSLWDNMLLIIKVLFLPIHIFHFQEPPFLSFRRFEKVQILNRLF